MGASRARSSIRSVVRAGHSSWRRLRGQPVTPAEPEPEAPTSQSPTVSVVVPVYNVEDYIDESLHSLRAQTHRRLQIIIVDDGSTDSSADICRRHAAEDPRLLVLHQANAGQGAARNHGLDHATGDYLTFLDPDDLLPVHAYATMVSRLETSGSDFVIGSVLRMHHGVFSSPSWITRVHVRDRVGIAIDDFPDAVLDVICCNRMLRRSFWEREQIRFPEGVAYEDHVPMMQAFVRARSFDVLSAVTYHWRTREDFTSTGQRKRELQNLRDRVAAKEQAAELLRGASTPVRDAWMRRVLDIDLYGFVRQLGRADDAYWEVLRAAVRRLLEEADSDVLSGVRVTRKVEAWLLAEDRREELRAVLRWQEEHPRDLPTELRDDRVLARFPVLAEAADLPEEVLTLTDYETRLSTSLRSATSTPANDSDDAGAIVLTGWAHPRLVDLSSNDVIIAAALVEDTLGLRLELPVTPADAPEADGLRGHARQSYRRSGFVAEVDPAALAARTLAANDEPEITRLAAWRLEVTCAVAEVVRTGGLRSRDSRSSAGELPSVSLPGGLAVVSVMDPVDGLRLEVRRPRAVLTSLSIDGRTVRGSIRPSVPLAPIPPPGPHDVPVPRPRRRLRLQATRARSVLVELEDGHAGELSFAAELPVLRERDWGAGATVRRMWSIDVVLGAHTERLAWPAEQSGEWWPTEPVELVVGTDAKSLQQPDVSLKAQRSERGNVQLCETNAFAVVHEITLSDDEIVVSGRWLGAPPESWQPRLQADRDLEGLLWLPTAGEHERWFVSRFALSVERWGRGARVVPSGTYLLEFVLPDGEVVRPRMSRALVQRTVLRHQSPECQLQVRRGAGRQVLIQVSAPLTAEERSAFGQRVLQERYVTSAADAVDDSVLMQVGDGDHASDSALALYRELRAHGDRTPVTWSVKDLSREVPAGAATAVLGSVAWYQALARAKTVVLSGLDAPHLRPRASQTVLQTFRGYPIEPDQAAAALSGPRVNRWSAVLAADRSEARDPARLLRWRGPRLAVGWPRDDLVTGPEVTERRKVVRTELGLDDDDLVLLWAPAWRQSPATGGWEPADGASRLSEAAAGLAADAVVLFCGGTSDDLAAASLDPARALRVHDVRRHPRIDDLVLASDAAVIGSPALAEQYAGTERPQLDLADSPSAEQLHGLLEQARRAGPRGPSVARGAAAAVVKVLWPHLQ